MRTVIGYRVMTSDGWYVHEVGVDVHAKPEKSPVLTPEDAGGLSRRWLDCGYLPFMVEVTVNAEGKDERDGIPFTMEKALALAMPSRGAGAVAAVGFQTRSGAHGVVSPVDTPLFDSVIVADATESRIDDAMVAMHQDHETLGKLLLLGKPARSADDLLD